MDVVRMTILEGDNFARVSFQCNHRGIAFGIRKNESVDFYDVYIEKDKLLDLLGVPECYRERKQPITIPVEFLADFKEEDDVKEM